MNKESRNSTEVTVRRITFQVEFDYCPPAPGTRFAPDDPERYVVLDVRTQEDLHVVYAAFDSIEDLVESVEMALFEQEQSGEEDRLYDEERDRRDLGVHYER